MLTFVILALLVLICLDYFGFSFHFAFLDTCEKQHRFHLFHSQYCC